MFESSYFSQYCHIDSIVYVDGEIINNLSIELIICKYQKIIMIDVTAVSEQTLTPEKLKIG